MRIHDIEIRNFRSLDHFQLRDIPDTGVIVISGDNEAGKSTVVEALQLLQNPKVKFDSNTTQLKSIQTLGKDEPIFVSMRATLGPVTFRITKQYKKKSSAVLTIEAPRRAEYKGREAEDQFRKLMSDHLDVSLANALLVPQGEVDPAINAAGIPTLGAALEEMGGGSSHADDTELMRAVEERYTQFYTAKGRPRGDLERAQRDLTQAVEQRASAEREVALLEEDIAQVERETKTLAQLSEEIPQAKTDLHARRAEHDAALQQQGELDKAAATVITAQHDLSAATAALEQRQAIRTELAEAKTQHATLIDGQEALLLEQQAHTERLTAATQREREGATAVLELREKLLAARKTHEKAQAAFELAGIRSLLKDLDSRSAALKALREQLPASPLTSAQVNALEEAELALKIAEAKVAAQAATVTLIAETPTDIEVDGEAISLGDHQVALTTETLIRIGAVTATFTPAVGGEDDKAELAKAQEDLHALRGETGCESAAEARTRFDAEQHIIRKVSAAERERDAALGGKDESKLRDTADLLARAIGEGEEPASDIAAAKEEVQRLEDDLAEAERSLDSARSALDAEQKNNKQVELSVQHTRVEAAAATIARMEEKLAQAVETEQELELAVDKATVQVQSAEAELQRLREELPDLEVVKHLLEGAEEKLAVLQQAMHTAEKNIDVRRGHITLAEGAAEKLIQAREAAEAAQFRMDQVQTQAEGIALLRETLLRHRDAARARYAAPFAQKLTSLASVLYGPGVEFELTDQLDIEQRVLSDTAVALADLSGGAREQLGILTRFAVAELVSKEQGVPIFLDDALGYSDRERLARMNYLLGAMGKQHQVFVLTCMPSRYADVLGKKSYEMTQLKSDR